MTPDVKPIVAGNWKMNGLRDSLSELKQMIDGHANGLSDKVDMLICPPATLLYVATTLADGSQTMIGAQDCHTAEKGAHTGDISAPMIADALGSAIIVGHSERRTDHGESNALIAQKAQAAWSAGLVAVICIGETQAQRNSGETLDVLKEQLAQSIPDDATASNTIVAYEPVWAIGTGMVPSPEDVEQAHAFIRTELAQRFGKEGKTTRILYGGSVKPDNAVQLMSIVNVDGALVGGASLKAADFLAICYAYTSIT